MPPQEYRTLDESRVPPGSLDTLRAHAEAKRWPIYLFGPVGRGKSFLAALAFVRWTGTAAMVRYADVVSDTMEVEKSGELSRYNSAGQLVEHTRASWWRFIESVGLLVIDEIGSGMEHVWRTEILWGILERRKHRPMILTGNLKPSEVLAKFDERIHSRLQEGALVQIGGNDQRLDGIRERVSILTNG